MSSNIYIAHIPHPVAGSLQFITPLPKQADSLAHRVHAAVKSFEHAWNYIGKSLLTTRHFMNATIRSARFLSLGCKATKRLQEAVTRLKLFIVIGLPFSLASIPSQIAKIGKRFHLKDGEGVVLSTISFSLVSADIFDSTTSFVGAVLQTLSKTPPRWLSVMSMPISIGIVTFGSLSRTIHLIRLGQFYGELERDLIAKMSIRVLPAEELQQLLKSYLQKKTEVDGAQSQEALFHAERLEAIAERQSNVKVLAMIKELKAYIQPDRSLSEKDIQRITEVIGDMEKAIRREIGKERAYLFTNMLNGMALSLFFMSIASPIAFLLLGISMSLRILLISESLPIGALIPRQTCLPN